MTDEQQQPDKSKMIKAVNGLNINMRIECDNNIFKNIETATEKATNAEFKKIMSEFLEQFKNIHGMELKDFNVDETKEEIKKEKTIAKHVNEEKIIKIFNEMKKQLYNNLITSQEVITNYRREIIKRDTVQKHIAELAAISNIKDCNPLVLINRIDSILNDTKTTIHPEIRAIYVGMMNKALELKVYKALTMLFNYPDTEYVKAIQNYTNKHKYIANSISQLIRPAQTEANSVIEKMEAMIKLYSIQS